MIAVVAVAAVIVKTKTIKFLLKISMTFTRKINRRRKSNLQV